MRYLYTAAAISAVSAQYCDPSKFKTLVYDDPACSSMNMTQTDMYKNLP